MPVNMQKRPRGNYSKLICLHCRSRKIRCVLPDDVTIQPSGTPQAAGQECERCRHKGLECVVDHTTLGRPARKRAKLASGAKSDANGASNTPAVTEAVNEPGSADVEDFLLSHPDEGNDASIFARWNYKPSLIEMCETISSPFRLFSCLLTRNKAFASSTTGSVTVLAPKTVLKLVTPSLASILDKRLVWHRLYFPYIPNLASLRQECASQLLPDSNTNFLLLALLSTIALDVRSTPVQGHKNLREDLGNTAFQLAQEFLFGLPRTRRALLVLELMAEYQPLILASTPQAAAFSVTGDLYITLAKEVAQRSRTHSSASCLREILDTRTDVEIDIDLKTSHLFEALIDTLQWCNVIKLEIEKDAFFRAAKQATVADSLTESFEFAIETLQLAANRGCMPGKAYFLFHRLASFSQLVQQVSRCSKDWKSLESLADIIVAHQARCEQEKEEVNLAIHNLLESRGQTEQALAVSQLCEAEIHNRNLDVVGTALFYGIMAGAHSAATHELDPEEAVQVSDHIIHNLQQHEKDDPRRPPLRIFLEKFGTSRTDELERALTNFIGLCADARLQGVPYAGPTRHTTSDILFRCKDIVENNAARLKGWGALQDRVDTQLILLQECARRLEGMEAGADQPGAVAQGSLCAASAQLVRSLHRILAAGKRSVTENQRRRVASSALSGPSTATPMEAEWGEAGVAGASSMDFDELLGGGDVFSDWSNWPQVEALDFSQLLADDLNWEVL